MDGRRQSREDIRRTEIEQRSREGIGGRGAELRSREAREKRNRAKEQRRNKWKNIQSTTPLKKYYTVKKKSLHR
jgi:hypothetical protein